MPEQVQAAWLAPALRAIGLSGHAIDVVTAILEAPGATAGELAKAAHLHRNQVYRALRELDDAGLVHPEGDRPQRFFLAPVEALARRLQRSLEAHGDARRTLLDALRRLDAPLAPVCHRIPPSAMPAEIERFVGRGLDASFDTWPREFPPPVAAPRRIAREGRPAEGVRVMGSGPTLRYLLAGDAGLLFEGPATAPGGHLILSPSGVALLRDHFEATWRAARDVESPRIADR